MFNDNKFHFIAYYLLVHVRLAIEKLHIVHRLKEWIEFFVISMNKKLFELFYLNYFCFH